jgi:hypothetical protein
MLAIAFVTIKVSATRQTEDEVVLVGSKENLQRTAVRQLADPLDKRSTLLGDFRTFRRRTSFL